MSESDDFWRNRRVDTGFETAEALAQCYNRENWRFHPEVQRLATEESLDALGWIGQVKKSTVNGLIFDGHLRVELALLKNPKMLLPVDYYDLDDDETAFALTIHDAITEQAQPIADKLAALLDRTRHLTADKPGLAGMLEQLRMRAGVNGNGSGSGQEPETPTEIEAEKYHKRWGAKLGDVWQLGRHIIACLDSLDEANIKEVVGDSVVTFAFADPPYGINIVAANVSVGGGEAYDIPFGGVKNKGYVGGGARIKASPGLYPIQTWSKNRTAATDGGSGRDKPFGSRAYRAANGGGAGRDNIVDQGKYYPVAGDSTIETAQQSASLLLGLYPDACHVWWGANYYTDVLPPSPCWIVWDKDNTGNFADCEMAWTNQPTAARIFEHRWNGMLKASEQGQRRIHPTQKPIALARYCFETYGESGDIILDPFLGSGITVLAAEQLGDRRVIGFELEPVYVSTVLQRWADLTHQQPRLVSG